MNSINLYIFYLINNIAGRYQSLDTAVIFLTNYLAYSVSIVVSIYVCVWLPFHKNKPMARLQSLAQGLELFLSTTATAIIMLVLKVVIAAPRPFTVLSNVHVLLPNERGYSFPSGHASITFAIATVVYFYHKRLGIFLYLFSLLVALSRIYVGVHYPIDVLAGILLGLVIPILFHLFFKTLHRK
jgi:undecaprenyl-diphosphatase